MTALFGRARAAGVAALCLLAISCGGGGNDNAGVGSGANSGSGGGSGGTTTQSASNVAPAVVNSGPNNDSVNTLYVSVTVCVPGSTADCQTIDNVEVDTASYGLRILSSVLTVNLPVQTLGGRSLLECTNFVQGYSWGPVALASVQVAGEFASSVPVQVIGDPAFASVPSDCMGLGTAVNTVAEFGANAILGVGPFIQDCGTGCAAQAVPTTYYACSTTSDCAATAVPLTSQVQNPVNLFAADNNGVIVELPSVPAAGAASVSGSLIFGIDTQSNNVSNANGTETVLTLDDVGYLTVTFNGQTLPQSFIDSGTNGIYFNDSNLAVCTESGLKDFYCPPATTSFSATLTGNNGDTAAAEFSIANAADLLSNNPGFTAFADLGGTFPGSTSSFDLGLPFYYGRRVATAIEGYTTTVGTGPYFAF